MSNARHVRMLEGGDSVRQKGIYVTLDEDLYRLLKIKTMIEGKSLKQWFKETVKEYVKDLVESDFLRKREVKNGAS